MNLKAVFTLEGPRAAKLEELPKIIRLTSSIFLSSMASHSIMSELFPQLFNEHNLENLRVIVQDGTPISHVGIWEGSILIHGSTFKVGMIGGVCTHPDHRGKGYASALVKDAFAKMRVDHVDFALVSGFRDLYKRVGCVEAGRIYRYRIRRKNFDLRNDLSVAPYEKSFLRKLVKIYQKEPVRYRRSLEEFKLLTERELHYSGVKFEIYMAPRGSPLAYVAFARLNENIPQIIEYAGPRSIVLRLIDKIFKVLNVDVIELIMPFHDSAMLHLLEKQNLKKPQSEAPASIAIINPECFLEKVQPYLEETIGRAETQRFISNLTHGKIKIYLNKKEATPQNSRTLTLLFFGSPEKIRVPPPPKIVIEPYLQSLSDALPLPTPLYTLNYI